MGTNKWKGSKMVINKRKAKETGNQQVKLGKSRFHGFPILNKMDRKSEDQTRSFFPLVKTCWLPFFNPILPKTCWLPIWISRPNFPKKKQCAAHVSHPCVKKKSPLKTFISRFIGPIPIRLYNLGSGWLWSFDSTFSK